MGAASAHHASWTDEDEVVHMLWVRERIARRQVAPLQQWSVSRLGRRLQWEQADSLVRQFKSQHSGNNKASMKSNPPGCGQRAPFCQSPFAGACNNTFRLFSFQTPFALLHCDTSY